MSDKESIHIVFAEQLKGPSFDVLLLQKNMEMLEELPHITFDKRKIFMRGPETVKEEKIEGTHTISYETHSTPDYRFGGGFDIVLRIRGKGRDDA